MANQLTKILIRRGSDVQRKTANTVGIAFDLGEPAFTFDTKRLYVGDGITSGGIPVGVRNLGSVGSLFGNDTNGFSTEAVNVFALSGCEVGDIIYDRTTRVLYSLSARSNNPPNPPLSANLTKYDTAALVDESYIAYNTSNQLTIIDNSIDPTKVSSSLAAPGGGLQKVSSVAGINIAPNGVLNSMLNNMPGNSVKINNTGSTNIPTDVIVNPKQVVGRTATSGLTAINFNDIIVAADFNGSNGIGIDRSSGTPVISLSSNVFTLASNTIAILQPLTLSQTLRVNGIVNLGSTLSASGIIYSSNDIVAFSTSDVSLKENIKTISSPLDKLNKISGYNFDWKTSEYEHLKGSDVGVLAHEVEQIIPEAVTTRSNGIKAVNYTKVIPLLIESIKELKQEIKELKNEKL
jgi:hypothetical protein